MTGGNLGPWAVAGEKSRHIEWAVMETPEWRFAKVKGCCTRSSSRTSHHSKYCDFALKLLYFCF